MNIKPQNEPIIYDVYSRYTFADIPSNIIIPHVIITFPQSNTKICNSEIEDIKHFIDTNKACFKIIVATYDDKKTLTEWLLDYGLVSKFCKDHTKEYVYMSNYTNFDYVSRETYKFNSTYQNPDKPNLLIPRGGPQDEDFYFNRETVFIYKGHMYLKNTCSGVIKRDFISLFKTISNFIDNKNSCDK